MEVKQWRDKKRGEKERENDVPKMEEEGKERDKEEKEAGKITGEARNKREKGDKAEGLNEELGKK